MMKVTVLVMTYNHEDFIAQALDSALMQETNFDFEILISEDCSTDATRDIVQAYRAQHPDKIRLLLSEKNVASNQVVARGFAAARGQYLALLDGDDYWLSPHKLQRQVDFLDAHPDCTICFHNAQVEYEDGSRPSWLWTPADHPPISTMTELWRGNFIATCTTVYRLGTVPDIPAWYDDFFPITDWPLHLLHAEQGKIGYINEVLGVYRYHRGGYYSGLSQRQKLAENLDFYRRINACLDYRYDDEVKTAVSIYFLEWAEAFADRGDWAAARASLRTCLRHRPLNRYTSARRLLDIVMRLYTPRHWLGGVQPRLRSPEVN